MNVKISRPNYPALRNSEFPVVAEQTFGIVEKSNPENKHLGKSFAVLIAFRAPLNALSVFMRKNAKLEAAGKLDFERDTLINGFYKVVSGFENIDLPQIKPNFETLDALLDKHKARTIAADGRASETERLTMLEKDIAGNPAAQAAIEAFGLLPVVQRLFEANKEYDVAFREYIAEKGTEERIDVPTLRRDCTKALGQFFDAVQYCAFAHEDIDYTDLAKELNKLNEYYIAQLKARATRRKNGKNTDSEQPIPPPTE